MAKFKKRSSSFIDDDGDSDVAQTSKATKKAKTVSSSVGEGKDSDGNPYWELSNKRRIGVSKFKANLLINIREYYEADDGEMKPGKKGISLSIEQYQTLLKAVPAINKELRKQGHVINDVDAPVVEAQVGKPAKSKKKTKEPKSNFEATSDEEEDSE